MLCFFWTGRCHFVCNFPNFIPQICFHLTHGRIHWSCSVSVILTLHFALIHCGLLAGWPNVDVTSCLDRCSSICGYFEQSFWLLEFEDRRNDSFIQVKNEIFCSSDLFTSNQKLIIETSCTLSQTPSIQFCSYHLDARSQYQLYILLVSFIPSQHILYRNVLRWVTAALCHFLLYFVTRATQLFGEGLLIQLLFCDLPCGSCEHTEAGSARIRWFVIQFDAISQVGADKTTDKVCKNAFAGKTEGMST